MIINHYRVPLKKGTFLIPCIIFNFWSQVEKTAAERIPDIYHRHHRRCLCRDKNTKCPIDAHCHCHYRRDPRILDWEVLQVLSFWVFLDFGKEFPSFLKISCQNQRKHRRSKLAELFEILCNPWISSAMAMAMSIYRTLCVLVIFKFETSQQQPRMFFISRPLMQLVINYQMFCNTSK